ncbi:MAG: hypothetical protein ACI970_001784, partial [Myxococcota bacterium]
DARNGSKTDGVHRGLRPRESVFLPRQTDT